MSDSPRDEIQEFALMRQPAAVVERDGLGFVTSEQTNLSAPQVKFILARASTEDNVEAAEIAGVDLADVLRWFEQPDFNAAYIEFIKNKREGVKQIGSQLLPRMLLELTKIVENGTNKEVLAAAKLLAQMQGMLITQNAPVDKGLLEQIREELMRPRPVMIRDVT